MVEVIAPNTRISCGGIYPSISDYLMVGRTARNVLFAYQCSLYANRN